MQITWVTAFAAGVASFLSPCVLPLVPGYISYMTGLTLDELTAEGGGAQKRSLLAAAAFVLGFSVVFTLLGASASAVGRLLDVYRDIFSYLAGSFVIVLGLHTMGLMRIRLLYVERRFQATGLPPGIGAAFVMGLAFAFGWTPCIGPILAGILALAANEASVHRGMALLFVYSMGLGIPFLLTASATSLFMRFFQTYKRFIHWGEIAAGALLVVVGVLILTNKLTLLTRLLPAGLNRFAL